MTTRTSVHAVEGASRTERSSDPPNVHLGVFMVLNDDAYASQAQLGLFIDTTTVVAGYAIHLHRALLAQPRRPTGQQVIQTPTERPHDRRLR